MDRLFSPAILRAVDPAPYYTQNELAKRAGLSRSAVGKAIERGLLVAVTTAGGDAVLIERAEAERWLTGRKTTPGPAASDGPR